MSDLADGTCEPCRGDIPPLEAQRVQELLARLSAPWRVVAGHHLEREYAFPDFRTALDFTNLVGELAEREGHHPDLHLAWGRVVVTIFTHAVDGLTESDFVLAAKIDRLSAR